MIMVSSWLGPFSAAGLLPLSLLHNLWPNESKYSSYALAQWLMFGSFKSQIRASQDFWTRFLKSSSSKDNRREKGSRKCITVGKSSLAFTLFQMWGCFFSFCSLHFCSARTCRHYCLLSTVPLNPSPLPPLSLLCREKCLCFKGLCLVEKIWSLPF